MGRHYNPSKWRLHRSAWWLHALVQGREVVSLEESVSSGEELVKAVYGAVNGPFDYAGVSEVASYLGVSKQVVVNWRNRKLDFPTPVAELGMGPIWHLCDIRDWARINQKGPFFRGS